MYTPPTPTRRNSTVSSRRCRRCVLGLRYRVRHYRHKDIEYSRTVKYVGGHTTASWFVICESSSCFQLYSSQNSELISEGNMHGTDVNDRMLAGLKKADDTRPNFWADPWCRGLPREEIVRLGLISLEVIFQEFQTIWTRYLNVTDRRTDGRTTCFGDTALCK